jgi:hypothetical protein
VLLSKPIGRSELGGKLEPLVNSKARPATVTGGENKEVQCAHGAVVDNVMVCPRPCPSSCFIDSWKIIRSNVSG